MLTSCLRLSTSPGNPWVSVGRSMRIPTGQLTHRSRWSVGTYLQGSVSTCEYWPRSLMLSFTSYPKHPLPSPPHPLTLTPSPPHPHPYPYPTTLTPLPPPLPGYPIPLTLIPLPSPSEWHRFSYLAGFGPGVSGGTDKGTKNCTLIKPDTLQHR